MIVLISETVCGNPEVLWLLPLHPRVYRSLLAGSAWRNLSNGPKRSQGDPDPIFAGLFTLDRQRRQAMEALYSFMRLTDDLGDDEGLSISERTEQLIAWRKMLDVALAGESQPHPLMPALVDTISRYKIPAKYLHDVITGVEMDLHPVQLKSWAELEKYAYHVAGAVGLCCIHIWGFQEDQAQARALACGRAMQYTNILRDVNSDLALGRVYLPEELLRQHRYSLDDLRQRAYTAPFVSAMREFAEVTRANYREAALLVSELEPPGRPILRVMLDTYQTLLERIEHAEFRVFEQRIRVPVWQKLWFVGRTFLPGGFRRT